MDSESHQEEVDRESQRSEKTWFLPKGKIIVHRTGQDLINSVLLRGSMNLRVQEPCLTGTEPWDSALL